MNVNHGYISINDFSRFVKYLKLTSRLVFILLNCVNETKSQF